MTDYEQLVKALRCCTQNPPETCVGCTYNIGNNECAVRGMMCDAAAAIEELQQIADHHEQSAKDYWKEACEYKAQLPKRGEWIKRHEFVEDMRFDGFRCSICNWWKGDFETYNYCPKCGAKMEVPIMDGPIITPCRGCSDYDGYGGCKSKGGCSRAKMEVHDGQ